MREPLIAIQAQETTGHSPYALTLQLFLAILVINLMSCTMFESNIPICNSSDMRCITLQKESGNCFIGRRMYKTDYKMWGWIRQPREPWSRAKLVMLNEQKCLAPDRKKNNIGYDNNYEYYLEGYFSGQTVYEPASDQLYPEFVLLKASPLSITPINIYRYKEQLKPDCRLLSAPCS